MKSLVVIVFLSVGIISNRLVAQGVYNNGANIVITSGTDVYVDGDNSGDYFTTSNGEIDVKNTAELFVEGDWTNNNGADNAITTSTTTGWVRFEGNSSALQTIGGNAATTFPYLEFNNSNGVTLNQNASSPGQIELTLGAVSTGSNYLIHTSTAMADLVSYSSTAFVNGNYRRYFTQNTDAYAFPVGDGTATTNYKRYDFINSNLDLSGVDYLTVSVETITEGVDQTDNRFETVGSETCLGTPLNQIHSGAIWTVTPQSTTINSGSYGVQLYVENVGDGLTSNSLDNKFTVVKRAEGSSDYAHWESVTCIQGTSIPANGAAGRIWNGGNGYAQKTGLTSFSEFAIASASFVLPVDLTEFTTSCQDDKVKLYWQTQSEEEVDYFEVERSFDGNNYERIKTILAQGFSNQPTDYFVVDANTKSAYYRLKSVDFDGHQEYFNPVFQAACQPEEGSIAIQLNPQKQLLLNSSLTQEEQFQVIIVDALGKTLFAGIEQLGKGESNLVISFRGIATGTYYVSCIGNKGSIYTEKLFIH